jgi:FkbM family methyltransferase
MNESRMATALRAIVWRIGRKLYTWARREVSQGPEASGEYWLLAQAVNAAPGTTPCFLDIGARLGDWSECAQGLLKRRGMSGHVHAFEPSTASYAHLTNRFNSNESVQVHKLALSDQSCLRDFFVVGDLAGVNSLIPVAGAKVEQVDCTRTDDFLAAKKIENVVFAKIDAEGHDFNILLGAADLFRQGRVDACQFEYNHRWLASRAQLKDVFDFIADKPYRLGKLHASGIEVYEQWHPELERFFEANYVLVRQGSVFEKLCSPVRFNRRNVLEPAGP